MVLAGWLASPLILRAAGEWLFVNDPLQRSDAIVVFAGHVPFRSAEAAALYKARWAPEVWLTRIGVYEEDAALERLGVTRPPEYLYERQVLIRLGVPESAIRILEGQNFSTADEVRTVARSLRGRDDVDRLILVTSNYHSRRVKAIWRTLTGNRPPAIVRHPPGDPFKADGWWRNTDGARKVSREWFGLLNAWLGFPLESRRW
jgi:uncharacterized SAM-binding protein YcdF (DUF218 family)